MNEMETMTDSATFVIGIVVLAAAFILALAIAVIMIIGKYKMFQAAGKAGWRAIIPVLNTYTTAQTAFGDNFGWTGFLIFAGFIPVIGSMVSAAANWYLNFKYAKSFGKSDAESILYILFAPVMIIIWLAKRDYEYIGAQESVYNRQKQGQLTK